MRISQLLPMGRLVLLILVSIGFLGFGIDLLITAFRIPDPYVFVLTFFSSNFIILISAALLVGFVIRAATLRKDRNRCD